MSENRPGSHARNIWKGIGLTAIMHFLPAALPTLYFYIGIVQLIYVIPALIIVRKNTGMLQGILIAAGITFLLNAACFGYVMISLSRYH